MPHRDVQASPRFTRSGVIGRCRSRLPDSGAEPEGHRAFDLRHDVLGLYRETSVYGGPEVMDLDLPARLVDRHFGHGRGVAVERVGVGDPDRAALPLLAPV